MLIFIKAANVMLNYLRVEQIIFYNLVQRGCFNRTILLDYLIYGGFGILSMPLAKYSICTLK